MKPATPIPIWRKVFAWIGLAGFTSGLLYFPFWLAKTIRGAGFDFFMVAWVVAVIAVSMRTADKSSESSKG